MSDYASLSATDNGPVIVGITTMMMVFTILSVFARLWVRLYRKVELSPDDGLLIAAFVFLIGLYSLVIAQVNYAGLGKPLLVNMMRDPNILNIYMRMLFAQELLAPIVLTFIKLSILVMYYRAFPVRSMQIACGVVGAFVIIWGVGVVIPTILQCDPIEKAWNPLMWTGTCNSVIQTWLGYGSTIPELVIDIVIIILPISKIVRLHNTLSTKIALCSIFALSGLVVISSIVRLVYGYRSFVNFATLDLTLSMGTVAMWTVVELCTAVICACLPVLRPALVMLLNRFGILSSKNRKEPAATEIVTIGGSGGRGGTGDRRLLHDGSSKRSGYDDSVLTATLTDDDMV